MKYALWIVPPEDIKQQLQKTVDAFASKYGGPIFEPHMTLLGNVEMEKSEFLKRAERLAGKIKPFKISLGETSFSTTYFQNVFVCVRANAALLKANMKAKEVYKVANDVFMPHISLLYGEQDMETREEAMRSVRFPSDIEFTVDRLVVTPSTSDPATWKYIRTISL